jgi:hypothetical protein
MPAPNAAAGALAFAVMLGATASATPAFTRVGGIEGMRYVPAPANDVYEATEDVAIDFPSAIDLASFTAALSVVPPTAAHVSLQGYGKRAVVQLRKTPGTAYALHVAAGVRALDGSATTQPIDVTVKTADGPVPAPLRSTPNEPYRYGVLAHPYPASLGGPNTAKIVDLLADAGVRFVRIDYAGDQIEHTRGTFDFSIEDRIADRLAARGITELPIVLQYSAPAWATGGAKYPAIWSDPQSYAQFAGAVAAHLAARYPHISRVELFNEPNLDGWWKNPANPAYAATDGTATVPYMRQAYAAIKAAAPALTIVGPALASGGHSTDPRTFFDHLYDGGCKRSVCWDVVSVHNYRWENPTFPAPESAANRFDIYKPILAIAAAHGDAGTHVMLTEWGYSTTGASADGVDPQTQAIYLALGFNLMLADPAVDGIVYVNMYNPAPDFWGQTALVANDFTPKPAFGVYRRFARGGK